MADAALLREVINRETITTQAQLIQNQWPPFKLEQFLDESTEEIDEKTLTERLDSVTNSLEKFLPQSFEEAADILIKSLPPEINEERKDLDGIDLGSENGFIIIALTNFIARNGKDHFHLSMRALLEMTKRFSSEGSIRHFIISHEKEVLEYYRKWALDSNVHVRRLVSESLRPRLPWAIRLQNYVQDPSPILEFLDILKDDPELYVRRSVANNLNDIAKDHPKVVTNTLGKWRKNESKEMTWLIKHALRTLIKKGDPAALEILGFHADAHISISPIELESETITLGEALNFSLTVTNEGNRIENLVFDYVIYHMKANGKRAPKVFKLKTGVLKPGESISLKKRHVIKKINTRTYYAGEHKIAMKVNGREFDAVSFNLKIS